MKISQISLNYSNNNSPQNKKGMSFCGKTYFYAFTDIHQNAELHCKYINKLIEKAKTNNNIVLLDNGDIFKGLYPKNSLINTYSTAKKLAPNLEIIYNVGNNDPGFKEYDSKIFREYLKILNQSGVKVISANIKDGKTGKIPEGVNPYVIVNRDGDNILYTGFVVDKIRSDFATIDSFNSLDALEKLAPEIKSKMKEYNCKGFVILLHDKEENAFKIRQKALELGLNPEFIIGGHVHHTFSDESKNIYYPEPFGLSMMNFNLDINKDKHSLKIFNPILPENCETGIFSKEIEEVKQKEEYNKAIAKSVLELKHNYMPEYSMVHNELGTFYSDAIKNITQSEIGLVPKSWIYDTLPFKKDQYITKIDVLKSCPQPFSQITQIRLTPDELKNLLQNDINKKNRIYEASQNVSIGLSSDNKTIKQIKINGEELFDSNGNAKEPERKISIAIDYFSIRNKGYESKKSEYSMYDGIIRQLKILEKEYPTNSSYPVSEIYKID